MKQYCTIVSCLLLGVFAKDFSAINAAGSEQTVPVPKSCKGLSDGTYFLKLIDNDDYPIVKAKCSNGYTMIDYEMDPNWADYFSTFVKYHYSVSGPNRNDLSNWEEWFQPSYLNIDTNDDTISHRVHTEDKNMRQLLEDDDSSSEDDDEVVSNSEFIISVDCDVCDESDDYQKWETSTSWYMSSLAFGCFNPTRGWPSCDMDFYSYECKVCEWNSDSSQILWEARDYKTEAEVSATGMMDGICDFTLRAHNDDILDSFLQCSSWSATDEWNAYKPSIGMKGSYCQCYKSKTDGDNDMVHVSAKEYNTKILESHVSLQKLENADLKKANEENLNGENVVHLTQSDFEDGTYRITESGTYLLDEDIVFDFNPGSDDDPFGKEAWWPKEEQNSLDDYPGAQDARGSYFLGFFAGVTIETSDVIFDLQGHSMAMSLRFFYSQPFFAIIELASQPFLPQQGPGFFGSDPQFASNTIVRNGILGLTSHHSIHGNYNNKIELSNLKIRDFQTHGIQLNGFQDTIIKDIEIGPSTDIAYLNGNFAHFRQGMNIFRNIADQSGDATISFAGREGIQYTMQDLVSELEGKMVKAWNYVVNGVADNSDGDWTEIYDLFINPSGLSYGAVTYGLFLNYPSAGIFGWHVNDAKSGSVTVENVYIHDLSRMGVEVVGLAKQGRVYCNLFNGPIPLKSMLGSWELIDDYQAHLWTDGDTSDVSYKYEGDIVSDIHLAMYEFGSDDFDNWPGIPYYGDSAELLAWAKGEAEHIDLVNPTDSTVYPYCNNDAMFHPSKGLLGLKVSGVEHASFSNLKIENLVDLTTTGHDVCGSKNLYHFSQQYPYQLGYCMNMVHAIAVDFSEVVMDGVDMKGIYSKNGEAFAFSTWFDTQITYTSDMNIMNVYSGFDNEEPWHSYEDRPNKLDEACAVRVYSSDTYQVTHTGYEDNMNIECVSGSVGCYGSEDEFTNIGDISVVDADVGCTTSPNTMNAANYETPRFETVHIGKHSHKSVNMIAIIAIAASMLLIALAAMYYVCKSNAKISDVKQKGKYQIVSDQYGTFRA